MDKAEIKKRILDALGNPVSGAFVDHIDTIVDAVVGTDSKAVKPAKETRIVEAPEIR
jgi:hypothetical protein